jgi:hypothetical protein
MGREGVTHPELEACETAMREYADLRDRVRVLMEWDQAKADLWMRTANPLLGNIRPTLLIAVGRGAKVRKLIESAAADADACHAHTSSV